MRGIIDIVREAGGRSPDGYKLTVSHMSIDTLKRLEALIRADEREACAKVCEQTDEEFEGPDVWGWYSKDYAKAIRARRKGGDYDRYERSEP